MLPKNSVNTGGRSLSGGCHWERSRCQASHNKSRDILKTQVLSKFGLVIKSVNVGGFQWTAFYKKPKSTYTFFFLTGFVSGKNLGAIESSRGPEFFSMAARGREDQWREALLIMMLMPVSHSSSLTQASVLGARNTGKDRGRLYLTYVSGEGSQCTQSTGPSG